MYKKDHRCSYHLNTKALIFVFSNLFIFLWKYLNMPWFFQPFLFLFLFPLSPRSASFSSPFPFSLYLSPWHPLSSILSTTIPSLSIHLFYLPGHLLSLLLSLHNKHPLISSLFKIRFVDFMCIISHSWDIAGTSDLNMDLLGWDHSWRVRLGKCRMLALRTMVISLFNISFKFWSILVLYRYLRGSLLENGPVVVKQ